LTSGYRAPTPSAPAAGSPAVAQNPGSPAVAQNPGVARRDRARGASACRLMMGQDQLDVAQLRLREGDLCRPVGPG
jgi:hypothetical protein